MSALVGPSPAAVERFRALVTRRLGLQFDDAKLGWLGEVLGRRVESEGLMAESYLSRLEADPTHRELAALAQELTVTETYFFRNIDQFRALREQVVPQRLGIQGQRRSLRILCAGCASGEEAYSTAMILHDLWADPRAALAIDAVDLNPAMIDKARRARYTPWALRDTPSAMQQRWFRPDGRDLVLDDEIRCAVQFELRNLSEEDAGLWHPAHYDVVFCRNVLMYFALPVAQAVVARIARALAPGGYLFLGHAETLRGLSQDFHLRHTHGSFYYQRKEADEPAAELAFWPAVATPSASASTELPMLAAVVDNADSWVEAIGKAAERVRALTQQAGAASGPAGTPVAATSPLQRALDLFRRERFVEAQGLLQSLPAESARDPDVMLLLAVLLVHSGQLAHAEDTCRRLLAFDEMNAGAHYVLALCREGVGDRQAAIEQDQLAAYLDPGFAMPRLHLGMLARRAGDRDAQRREFRHALDLLQREEASRLLLFGGGFGRDALLALCRAELRACGECT